MPAYRWRILRPGRTSQKSGFRTCSGSVHQDGRGTIPGWRCDAGPSPWRPPAAGLRLLFGKRRNAVAFRWSWTLLCQNGFDRGQRVSKPLIVELMTVRFAGLCFA